MPRARKSAKSRRTRGTTRTKAVRRSIAAANKSKAVTPVEKAIAKEMTITPSVLEAVCIANLRRLKAEDIKVHDRASIGFEIDILFTVGGKRWGIEVQDRFSHVEKDIEVYLPKLPLLHTKQMPKTFELKKRLAKGKGIKLIQLYEDEIMAVENVGSCELIQQKMKEYK